MRKSILLAAFWCSASFAHNDVALSAKELTQLTQEAKSLVKQFAGTLKPQLKSAMKQGGPELAVQVCSEQALAIAKQLSVSSGWLVKRVSLKARNQQTAIPDEWEHEILTQFDQRNAQGESAQKMAVSAQVGDKFRFMKAQGAEALCLTCHGTNIKPEVLSVLDKHYPKDSARDYQQGQIRGAFSVSKTLN